MNWKNEFIKKMFPIDERNRNIDEALQLKHQNLPNSLFMYRKLSERNILSFSRDEIWLSEPSKFNDPYDCLFSALINTPELIKDLDEGTKETLYHDAFKQFSEIVPKENQPEVKNSYVKQLLEQMQDMFHICCFSEIQDSILMWSHYADYHKGFCVGYDISTILQGDTKLPGGTEFLYPVIYRDEFPKPEETIQYFSYYATNDFQKENDWWQNYFALIKSTEWSYEKEWRLILPHAGKLTQTVIFPPKAIYLGCNVKKDCGYHCLLNIAREKGITVYQMELSKSEFKLVPKLISSKD